VRTAQLHAKSENAIGWLWHLLRASAVLRIGHADEFSPADDGGKIPAGFKNLPNERKHPRRFSSGERVADGRTSV
jgi:hypothetical protein